MRIVCQQTILMKYHALFVNFEKAAKFEIIIGGALYAGNFFMIFCHLLIFSNSKKNLSGIPEPSMSNRLDPEQDRYFFRPDLGHKCLQVISGRNWQVNS